MVKSSFIDINGSKSPFAYLWLTIRRVVVNNCWDLRVGANGFEICGKRGPLVCSVFLCLSRACLGNLIVFEIEIAQKWLRNGSERRFLCTVCELIDIAPDVDWLEGVRQTHLFKDDRDFLPVGRVPARHTHTSQC